MGSSTKDQSRKSSRRTSKDTSSATTLPGSLAGPSPSSSLDGQMLFPFGPDHALASHSAQQAKEEASTTSGTCGRNSCGSSPSADLQRSLASKLAARLDVDGSPEYALTWKTWDMQSGPPICALRARARRTSDSGYSGWPTPNTNSRGPETAESKATRPNTGGIDLQSTALLTGWATPTAANHRSPKSNQHGKNSRPLQEQAGTLSTAETGKPAASPTLNPAFSRWLMEFPESWDRLSPGWDRWEFVQRELTALGD